MIYKPRTIVVGGSFALRMARLAAAKNGAVGLQLVTLPQLAAHLAGGFVRAASPVEVEMAARAALEAGGFADLHGQADLPGMPRALVRTLHRLWLSGIEVQERAGDNPRLADLALLDRRVRDTLGCGVLVLPDLVSRSVQRASSFARLVGEARLERLTFLAPVWRPLVEALATEVPVQWADCDPPPGWKAGTRMPHVKRERTPAIEITTSAHPHAEAIEALRWARELIANGTAAPHDVAIVAAAPGPWDDSFLGLANGAALPLHFSHGIPALSTVEGQACAALADLFSQGLSFGRVHRVLSHSANRCEGLSKLPPQPLANIPAHAALTKPEQWLRALQTARSQRPDRADVATQLMPLLMLASKGLKDAASDGPQWLPNGAYSLWRTALGQAPAEALPFTLSELRVADGRDPGASIVWGPAEHLAAAPRPWMRLIGLTSRAWPQPRRGDPLLPDHILQLDPELCPSRPELDRRYFEALRAGAASGLSLSFARRTATGGLQAPSPLLPREVAPTRLARLRTPAHAYSEADRLLARPQERAEVPWLAQPVACLRARRSPVLTSWDGLVRQNHPAILATLKEVQSPASLRLLIRDPQAYTWRYALGWRSTLEETQTLVLDDRAFGELVHELLQHSVTSLEKGPGFTRATDHEIEDALADARKLILKDWPTKRPTPPPLLFEHLLEHAARLAFTALRLDGDFKTGTRSWTEVVFGDASASGLEPWNAAARVIVPGTELAIRGRIDRVEIAAGDSRIRVTDYKTGAAPPGAANRILAGGTELQRVLYSVAAHQHLPEAALYADIVYLGDQAPQRFKIDDVEAAIRRAAEILANGAALLCRGLSLPGPDARERWSPYRLARPAQGEPSMKDGAISTAIGGFAAVWSER